MDPTNYSLVSNVDPNLMEISFGAVQEGMAVLFEGKWYKALEDSYVENGMVGFKAEDEDFNVTVIEYRKSDMAYAPTLLTEREAPTAE